MPAGEARSSGRRSAASVSKAPQRLAGDVEVVRARRAARRRGRAPGSPVACAIPLIQGGGPPPKSNMYSQAMKLRERWTASAVHLVEQPRAAPAVSQLGSPRSQAPWMRFAFLKVDSGCSCRPAAGEVLVEDLAALEAHLVAGGRDRAASASSGGCARAARRRAGMRVGLSSVAQRQRLDASRSRSRAGRGARRAGAGRCGARARTSAASACSCAVVTRVERSARAGRGRRRGGRRAARGRAAARRDARRRVAAPRRRRQARSSAFEGTSGSFTRTAWSPSTTITCRRAPAPRRGRGRPRRARACC